MYSHRLDSPPPPSHFRRPWSPVELESYGQLGRQRREASESSFEALDLADYAMTLQQRSNDVYATPAPSHHPHYPEYPPTPPRSLSLATRSNYSGPPSLVSGGSSAPSHATSRRLQTPTHRPYSLPVASRKSSSPAPASRYGGSHNYPWIADDRAPPFEAHEVDVAAFPEWSRGWYNQQKQNGLKAPYDSTFSYEPDYLLPPRLSYAPPSSSGSASQRDLLPWSMDDDGRGINVTPEMKEERVKLLEKEFAGNGNHGGQWLDDSNVVGSVDAKGKIVTSGPKKRAIFRWAEGTFAFGAAVASLYSAIILKPVGTPPPKGTVPAYLLYFLSVITLLYMIFMFLLRPCCCAGRRRAKPSFEGPAGMMVLPVQGLGGAPKSKKAKGKKKGKDADHTQGVQVNLIVDPSMFGNSRNNDIEAEDKEDTPVSGNAGPKRRGLFEGLAMEEQWKLARKELKRLLLLDILSFLLWSILFVVILLGKHCPVGQFEGWCDGYNVATALTIFLAICYGFSVFFDIKDLHLSRVSPRSRT